MASGARNAALKLGLRYQNNNGRLKFNKGGPAYAVWYDVLHHTLTRGKGQRAPFSEIIAIIDKYGPQVWTDMNEELLEPGVCSEYPVALKWPRDRDR